MDRVEIRKAIKSNCYRIIDLRSSDSFNGWILNGETLKGHIKGAINVSVEWFERESLLIEKDKKVILCYSTKEELKKGCEIFREIKNITYFDMKNLTLEDSDLVEYYKNYKLLVPPSFSFENKEVKIFHVGYGEEEGTSRKGHIKGSVYIDTDEVEPPPKWSIGSKEVLENIARKYGLNYKDTVVITGWNQMAAFRVALIFEYMGIEDVRVLNGGLEYYEKLGYPLTKEKGKVTKDREFGLEIPNKKEIIITTDQVKENLEKENFILVDNRTLEEYLGVISGYTYYDKAARVPKAKFGYAGFRDAYSLEYYRNIDGTMVSKENIKHLWRDIDTQKKLVFMCGSGWRASEVYFYAKVLGYEHIGIYSDGWIGWSRDEKNPIEKG